MKNLLLSLIFFTALSPTYAQDLTPAQIPDAVASAVKKAYPQTDQIKWKQKKELYKADFKVGKTDHELWLSKAGIIEKHSYEIKAETLPTAVATTIKQDFAGYTTGKCEQTDEKGVSTYKVQLKNAAGKKHLKFGADGKALVKADD